MKKLFFWQSIKDLNNFILPDEHHPSREDEIDNYVAHRILAPFFRMWLEAKDPRIKLDSYQIWKGNIAIYGFNQPSQYIKPTGQPNVMYHLCKNLIETKFKNIDEYYLYYAFHNVFSTIAIVDLEKGQFKKISESFINYLLYLLDYLHNGEIPGDYSRVIPTYERAAAQIAQKNFKKIEFDILPDFKVSVWNNGKIIVTGLDSRTKALLMELKRITSISTY